MTINQVVQGMLLLLLVIQLILVVELLVNTVKRHQEDKKFWERMKQEQEMVIARYKAEKEYYERKLASETPENPQPDRNENEEK